MSQTGQLFIVSTGVGDPDNITVKAKKIIKTADLIVALDGQVENFPELMQGKQIIHAGHGLFTNLILRRISEEEAEKLAKEMQTTIREAYSAGKKIVVLEMGDPSLFGPHRGYAEAFKDLNPVVVPGVSSFNAANALLSMPLLDKQEQRVQISGLAALEEASKDCLPDKWILFSMGLDLPKVIARIQSLYPQSTDISFVLQAGFEDQRIISTTVGKLNERLKNEEIPWACLIYIGAV